MSEEAQATWESYRPYLELLARSTLAADVHSHIDLSGAVQETLISVERSQDTVQFETEVQKRAYLRKTLLDVLDDRMAADSPTVSQHQLKYTEGCSPMLPSERERSGPVGRTERQRETAAI
jgi:hypothetical protein